MFWVGIKCCFVVKAVLEVLSKLLCFWVFVRLWISDIDHGSLLKVCINDCFSYKMGDGSAAAEALDAKVVGKALVCCELFCCYSDIFVSYVGCYVVNGDTETIAFKIAYVECLVAGVDVVEFYIFYLDFFKLIWCDVGDADELTGVCSFVFCSCKVYTFSADAKA